MSWKQVIADALVSLLLALAAALAGILLFASLARADMRAVVRIKSHGISGTVIATSPGKTYILTCGHGFNSPRARVRHVTIDAPAPRGGQSGSAQQRLVRLDLQADLALITMDAGPLPYVAPVARQDAQSGERCSSVGYDQMRGWPYFWSAQLLGTRWHRECGWVTRTVEKPGHGRSGGPLLNSRGELIGTVIGFDMQGGIYTSHASVVQFLWGR